MSRLITGLTHGNGLLLAQTHTADYELARHRLLDGAATVIDRTLARADKLNVTGIADAVTPANSMTFGYTAANRLNASTGPYGTLGWQYDGVGNRTQETVGPAVSAYAYPATSNRISSISTGGSAVRQMTYDGGGNMLTDVRLGSTYAYTYNNANRLKTTSYEGNLRGTYTYNGLEQLIVRVVANLGTANGTTHYIHDRGGNIIAETNGTAATAAATLREYVWLPEAEIAPTIGSRTVVDMPVAVVDGVNLPTPATWMVHVDHLHRPVRMTDATRAAVWTATWQPFGAPYQITGSAVLDARFPGQWFQLEAGLHYNWHRSYDASLGRYTQPDPLGFVDGPSVYGYARSSPSRFVDRDGRASQALTLCLAGPAACAAAAATTVVILILYPPKIPKFWCPPLLTVEDPPKPPDLIIDDKIKDQIEDRGWTEQEIKDLVGAGATGSSTDNTGGKTREKSEPATVYGSTGGYVVVNDRTGTIIQVSDRRKPGFIADPRIKWR